MIIAVAGERFGRLVSLYEEIKDKSVDWVIQVGSLGAFPDKLRWTKALKKGNTPDDFLKFYSGQIQVPNKTIFVPGRHDDSRWLEERTQKEELELAYNLSFIVNGYKSLIGTDTDTLSLVGLGKTFSPKTWLSGRQSTKDLNHYTRREVERACSHGPVDMLVCHEPPYGTKFNNRVSNAQGLQKVVFATQPKLVVHRSYDSQTKEYQFLNANCVAVAPYDIKLFSFDGTTFNSI